MSSSLNSLPSRTSAQQLLEDIPILEEWQRVPHPSNKVRDAMLKLGQHWNVQGKMKGKKRPAADVAKDLEERMLERGKELLTGSVAQPAESALGGSEESSADKLATSQTREPRMTLSSLGDMFAERSAETRVKKLLSDVAALRAWQSEAHLSHQV